MATIPTGPVRNPEPKTEGNPFIKPFNDLTDYIAGFGVGMSSLTIVVAAIFLLVAYLMGGRIGKVIAILACAVIAPILILKAGDFANLFI